MSSATTTPTSTLCRLPFPSGVPEQEQIAVMITDLRDYLHGDNPVPADEYGVIPGVEIRLDAEVFRFVGERAGTLAAVDGSTVRFPSLGVAVAHLLLGGYSAEYLGLDPQLSASWDGLKSAARSEQQHSLNEPREDWLRRPEAEREAIMDADDAATRARAERAHTVLDVAVLAATGAGLDELLASGRPYDLAHDRYLDGAREYFDGSGGEG